MKVFLDTSAIIKLYFREEGSEQLEQQIASKNPKGLIICELSKVEFASAIWKKIRCNDLTERQGKLLIDGFTADIHRFEAVTIDRDLIRSAQTMLAKYGIAGLRSLDAIQLACAVQVNWQAGLFKTYDTLLQDFFRKEGLPCD